jgi:hypothetical protein
MASRPNSTIPTRANPNPTGLAANNAGGPTNASAWNTMGAAGRPPAPNFTPTANAPATTVAPTNGIQPVSGIAPQMPNSATNTTPSAAPSGGTSQLTPLPGTSSMKSPNAPADVAWKGDAKPIAGDLPKPTQVMRASIPSPALDDVPAANSPPLPTPATMEIATPMPPAATGLTVQPVLMNVPPTKVRSQTDN